MAVDLERKAFFGKGGSQKKTDGLDGTALLADDSANVSCGNEELYLGEVFIAA